MNDESHDSRLLLLNALLNLYEGQAFELYKNLSYAECRELVDIASSGRVAPEDNLQHLENTRFNSFLDNISYNKFRWAHLDNTYNLWQIKDVSPKLLSTPLPSKLLEGIEDVVTAT